MYYKLKSSFLEDTLSDIFDEDGFDVSLDSSQIDASLNSQFEQSSEQSSQNISQQQQSSSSISSFLDLQSGSCSNNDSVANTHESTLNTHESNAPFSNLSELTTIALTNLRNVDENHIITNFEAEHIEQINENSWGRNLNKKINKSTSALPKNASQELRSSVTEKLFRQSSFSKRNPRKSLSQSISQNSTLNSWQSLQPTTTPILPDLETILIEKAKKGQEKDMLLNRIPPLLKSNKSSTLRSVDQGWLNRCNEQNALSAETPSATIHLKHGSLPADVQQLRTYGISNINVNILNSTSPSDIIPLSTTQDPSTLSFDMSGMVLNCQSQENPVSKIQSARHVLKKRKIAGTPPKPNIEEPITLVAVQINTTKDIHNKIEPTALNLTDNDIPVKKLRTTAKKVPTIKTKKKTVVANIVEKRPIPARRSNRNVRKPILYSDKCSDDSDEDPFATNSDSDPNFEHIEESIAEDSTAMIVANEAKSIKKKSETSKPKTTTTKKKRIAHKKKKKIRDDLDVDLNEDEDPEQYVIEYGTDICKSVPRINIDELRQNSQMFDNFVHASAQQPNITKASVNRDPGTSSQIKEPLTKREMDRDKMEKKIASGKLNENFVRINIQKKVFVRGRKVNNYSKYKKTAWKQKKAAAALAGPEMDMRGCDGGFLVCFNCGQQGHFAQNCKIQSKFHLTNQHL